MFFQTPYLPAEMLFLFCCKYFKFCVYVHGFTFFLIIIVLVLLHAFRVKHTAGMF